MAIVTLPLDDPKRKLKWSANWRIWAIRSESLSQKSIKINPKITNLVVDIKKGGKSLEIHQISNRFETQRKYFVFEKRNFVKLLIEVITKL